MSLYKMAYVYKKNKQDRRQFNDYNQNIYVHTWMWQIFLIEVNTFWIRLIFQLWIMKTLERIEFKILHNLFVLQNLNSFA